MFTCGADFKLDSKEDFLSQDVLFSQVETKYILVRHLVLPLSPKHQKRHKSPHITLQPTNRSRILFFWRGMHIAYYIYILYVCRVYACFCEEVCIMYKYQYANASI